VTASAPLAAVRRVPTPLESFEKQPFPARAPATGLAIFLLAIFPLVNGSSDFFLAASALVNGSSDFLAAPVGTLPVVAGALPASCR
jgi:hypothetical protein